jgi:hypothetical protein
VTCVPACKINPELSIYNFPNGISGESKEVRKKWINLIACCKDFLPTAGHKVRSSHFPGGRKTYANQLAYVNDPQRIID